MGFFSGIGASIAGGVIGAITDPITRIADTIGKTKVALAAEKNNAKRVEMEERVKGLEAKRDVLIAESGDKINRLMRVMIVLPWLVYWIKVIIFDKVLGAWTGWATDPLSSELATIGTVIIGFYFVDSIASRFTR